MRDIINESTFPATHAAQNETESIINLRTKVWDLFLKDFRKLLLSAY